MQKTSSFLDIRMWKSLVYLFDQQYNVMCETIFADDFIVLSNGKAKVGKLNGCSVEHLDELMVQLLHTHIKNTQRFGYIHKTRENQTDGIHLEESNHGQFLCGLWLA